MTSTTAADGGHEDQAAAGDETSTMEITGPIGTPPPPGSTSGVRRITAADGEA